jgi:Fe-S-cluster containining protein
MGDDEIDNISQKLKLKREDFIRQYTKQVDDRISLRDLEQDNWNCIMLKNGKCSIYEDRPLQCRTFPFWPQNICHEDKWEHVKDDCPGIGKGKLFTMDEIEDISDGTRTVDSVK